MVLLQALAQIAGPLLARIGIQSALAPSGPEAAGVAKMAQTLFAESAAILTLLAALATLALFAPRSWLAGKRLIVGGGIVLPLVLLTVLLVHSLPAAPRPTPAGAADVVIEAVGHQRWWQVDYLDAIGDKDFTTANELHIPVGAVVELRLRTVDMLYSFWVPALAGKLDLIPGKDKRLRLAAARPGTFRGQCAAYCGGPRAQMAFFVVAEDPARFAAWREAQRRSQGDAGGGEGDQSGPGQALFVAHCAACHTVRGTSAEGKLGPDLTHFASRISLGAGIVPNHAVDVDGWIAGHQRIKLGNPTPEFRAVDGEELRALASYLGSLE